jgi:hypothetical protein
MVGFQGIIAAFLRINAILTLSRWRERVGVRVDTNYIPLTFVLPLNGERKLEGVHSLLNFS